MYKIEKGSLVQKRWGKIEPEEQDVYGIVVEICPGRAWTYITVSYPFGTRTYRASELSVFNESR
jgi:hypothetical protein